jgi:hypothetical protein
MNGSGSIEPLVHAWAGVLESLRPQEKVTGLFVVIEEAFDRGADITDWCAPYAGQVIASPCLQGVYERGFGAKVTRHRHRADARAGSGLFDCDRVGVQLLAQELAESLEDPSLGRID